MSLCSAEGFHQVSLGKTCHNVLSWQCRWCVVCGVDLQPALPAVSISPFIDYSLDGSLVANQYSQLRPSLSHWQPLAPHNQSEFSQSEFQNNIIFSWHKYSWPSNVCSLTVIIETYDFILVGFFAQTFLLISDHQIEWKGMQNWWEWEILLRFVLWVDRCVP